MDNLEPSTQLGRRSVNSFGLLGEVKIPTGETFSQTEIGGLSGLVYDPVNGLYYALSDDRSSDARFYTLGIDLSENVLTDESIEFVEVTFLKDKDGDSFESGSLDPEGIALSANNTLYISSEGDANQLINPFIREIDLDGSFISELPIAEGYLPTADQSSGIRNNLAFENLTISPDQKFLYTATENALFQDGPAADVDQPSLSRITKYDLTTGQPVAAFVYEIEAVPDAPDPADGFRTNGLVELLAVDNNGTLLALERAFSAGVGNTVKLFEIQTQGALDVLQTGDLFRETPFDDDGEILLPGPFEIDPAVRKRELLDVERDLGIAPDNLEALAFGPTLADGRQSLIIASDNNFSAAQSTQFLALALDFDTTPVVLPTVETPYTVDDGRLASFEPLDILLVNDDGFDAAGIEVMYDALVAAGHNVTLVAPKEQQSGRGTLLDVETIFQPTEVVEFAPNQWYVDGSPVTTTLAALGFVLDGNAPDLVIAGINEGENVGPIAISSGTVGAATTATRAGIPAIAVSAGTLRDETFAIDEDALAEAYDYGAGFVVDLVKQLSDNRQPNAALLPDGVGLNVNIPAVVADIEGVKLTELDQTGTLDFFVGELAPGVPGLLFEGGVAIAPEAITVADSEGQNFLADFVTVTPIDGDWTSSANVRKTLSDRFDAAPADAVATPLNILLTNDDGFDAPGIEAIYTALTEAGHIVTLVGPKEQQSGTGTVLDVDKIFQPLEITNVEDNKWFVDAGVRTTTWAGLDFVLDGNAPDLVISGINEGENIGPGGAVSSGTVSAAVTALLREVPAIAVSAGIDLTDPERLATDAAYDIGSAFVVDLIAKLQATQGTDTKILPDGEGLSINIPVRFPEGVDGVQGVAFTDASDISPFVIDFGALPDGGAGLRFAPFELPADAEVSPTSEGAQFLSGFITVTPIDGDWTAPELGQDAVAALLSKPVPELLGDSDDPAIWVNPQNGDESVVISTLKDGGLVVFDLQGNVKQTLRPQPFGDIRYNNVDLLYGIEIPTDSSTGTSTVDLAVVSDRENDTLAIFSISETGELSDITLPLVGGVNDPDFSIFGVDDGEATAYGLATYKSPVDGKAYAFVTQADGNKVAQLELIANSSGGGEDFLEGADPVADVPYIEARVVRTIELPAPTGDVADSQSEGIVVDQEKGLLYVALENEAGILRFSAEPTGGNDYQVIQPVGADYLVPDIEGLSIYYGPEGAGYLIANSQGDSSYAVFSREGTNEYLGSFVVGDNGDIDQVNESDGLDIVNVALGSAFPNGLVVLQDGANDPQNVAEDGEELENNSTNFKFVPWESVANGFANPLNIDTTSYDPRNPSPQSLVNGVASGDVDQDSAVLWARSTFLGEVTFEYSTDADFGEISGTATATVADITQPVKVEVEGLESGSEYFYRVTDAAGAQKTGRFDTAAALGEQTGLNFGVVGDWRGEIAPYPAISNVAEKELDFFLLHGDTIYADDDSPSVLNPDGTPKAQAETVEEYRAKHNEVYSERFGENFWADVRASAAIYATIDDHEVTNDFAGGQTIGTDPRFQAAFPDDESETLINDSTLYENGLQVFQEFNPIRDEFYGETGDEVTANERKLYRYNTFGSDAASFVLDTRSFRDPAIPAPANFTDPNEVGAALAATFTPGRTLLGDAQKSDLKADLLDAQANGITWKFVMVPEPFQTLFPGINTDAWDGYNAERTELLKFIEDNDIENVVFVAADVHMTAINNITYQEEPFGEIIATSTFEITTGAVAYEDPTGVFLGNLFTAANPELRAFYDSLPIAPDADDEVNDKDDFVKAAINDTLLTPLGYDPIGLDDNLPQAEGLIDATLLQGDYYVGHSSSWAEFDIDPLTQKLTITTWGIDGYTEAELLADPDSIVNQTPRILSQFEVNPTVTETPINAPQLSVLGTYATGIFDESAAEINAFDPGSDRLFVINSSSVTIDILDLSDPSNPTLISEIDAIAFGAAANSVAVKNGVVAVAIASDPETDPGKVVFFDVDGNVTGEVTVGALPDSLTFTPDGTQVLVANEGQPGDEVDPEGSISIINVSDLSVRTASFTDFKGQEETLRADGVRIFPGVSAANDFEPEYIAVSPDGTTAYVTLQENNAVAVVDIATATVTEIQPLGVKNHALAGNGLDGSDRDEAINIQPRPVFGLYMPDAIATYTVNGQTYYVTANEGDARDEDTRISDLVLDPTAFPNAAELQDDAVLGRLDASTVDGDTDGDGDYDQLFTYGSRSFSIFDSSGTLVFDSGDDFEQITAQQLPNDFNANNDENDSFDNRSDNKGPEPEGVAVGEVDGRTYAFVGLERISGIMVYDITNPANSTFVQYINNRDFSGDAAAGSAGDLGPEGITFISAADSPTECSPAGRFQRSQRYYHHLRIFNSYRWRQCLHP